MGKRFSVAIGLNYGPENKRAEIGDVVDDLPADDIEELLALGAIAPFKEPKSKAGKS